MVSIHLRKKWDGTRLKVQHIFIKYIQSIKYFSLINLSFHTNHCQDVGNNTIVSLNQTEEQRRTSWSVWHQMRTLSQQEKMFNDLC